MKIYNRKKWYGGLLMLGIGVLNLVITVLRWDWDIGGIVLLVLLFAFGAGELYCSTSKQLSLEDKLEDLDERNRLVEMRAKSRAFDILSFLCFLLTAVFAVAGTIGNADEIIMMSGACGLLFFLSMIAEILSFSYYEKRL